LINILLSDRRSILFSYDPDFFCPDICDPGILGFVLGSEILDFLRPDWFGVENFDVNGDR
jgi:hypothetical protein